MVALAGVVLLGAIAFDTEVVTIGGESDLRQQAFDPDRFGVQEFPRIRDFVTGKAPDAVQLAEELANDKSAAIASYGTMAGAFPVLPVTFSGTVGEGKSGIFNVSVDGLPEGTGVRVQTGPAINGTELRDITGDIEFGAFKNQIEYQDAGAGINRAMAAEILADLDREALSGKTITVTGAFTMINPKNWLITPVSFEVQ
jgi:predicted lipoprotein